MSLCLSGRFKSGGESLHVALDASVLGEELNIGTIDLDGSGIALVQVLFTTQRGEAPVLRDDDLLATGELVLRTSESLESGSTICILNISFSFTRTPVPKRL